MGEIISHSIGWNGHTLIGYSVAIGIAYLVGATMVTVHPTASCPTSVTSSRSRCQVSNALLTATWVRSPQYVGISAHSQCYMLCLEIMENERHQPPSPACGVSPPVTVTPAAWSWAAPCYGLREARETRDITTSVERIAADTSANATAGDYAGYYVSAAMRQTSPYRTRRYLLPGSPARSMPQP